MLKKPTLVETPLAPTLVETPLPATPLADVPNYPAAPPVNPTEPVVTMADLMMELSIIGEVFAKRKLFAVVSLRHQNGHFNLTCSWKDDTGESRAFVGRKISDSLTPKGLALVVGELKLAVGI